MGQMKQGTVTLWCYKSISLTQHLENMDIEIVRITR